MWPPSNSVSGEVTALHVDVCIVLTVLLDVFGIVEDYYNADIGSSKSHLPRAE